jgi:NAD(P)-dependent dehydrogenase (short-subunit alcohol dehydrogenase family)
LITGATKGIGYATALKLNRQGYHVVGIAREAKEGFPGDLLTVDLSDKDKTHQVLLRINEKYAIDGIVNNVGIAHREPLGEIKFENFQSVMDLNLWPALDAMQILMNGMIERKYGRVVNIASRAVLGVANASSYAAAKAALIAFTKSWGFELAKSGITVNAVAPGPTATERFRKMRPEGSEAEQRTLLDIPMGRFAKPEEIAAAIAFFLSEDAGFITGQTLFVDGGGSIGRSMV